MNKSIISEVAARQQAPYSFDEIVESIATRFARAFIIEVQKGELSLPPEPKQEEPSYLTRKEAAEMLKVSLPTLHAMINAGAIKVTKAGQRTLIERSRFESDLADGKLAKYSRRK